MRSRYCYFGLYFPPSESFITTTFYEVILPFSRRLVCCLTSLVGISCAQPFTEDRHDLTHFRIAGAGVFDGVGDAVIWDGGLGHSSSPILRWFVDGSMVAEGFTVDLPAAEAYLLEVENQVGCRGGNTNHDQNLSGCAMPSPLSPQERRQEMRWGGGGSHLKGWERRKAT